MNWRDPDSTDEKRRMVEEHYGDTVPGYLLFHLGTITHLTDDEERLLNDLFFGGEQPGFGDKEMHGSHGYTGSYLHNTAGQDTLAPFIVLRIRDARRMHYAITLRGEERPFLQVTNGDSTKPVINFMERWGLSPQDVRTTKARLQVPADPFRAQTVFIPGEILGEIEIDGLRKPLPEGFEVISNSLPSAGRSLPPFPPLPLSRKTWLNKALEFLFG